MSPQMNQEEFNQKTAYPSLARKFDLFKTDWHLLYNFEYKRPIAISTWYATINLLSQHCLNSYPWYLVNKTWSPKGTLRFDENFDIIKPWLFKFDLVSEGFKFNNAGLNLDELYYFQLMREKGAALDIINIAINYLRKPFISDLHDQDQIYRLKKQEAEEVLSLPDDKINPEKYLFLNEYLKISDTDIKTAAREIVLQHDFYLSRLADTETARMKYSRAVIKATELVELKAIVSDFRQEVFAYARV